MNLMRFTVIDRTDTISFVADCDTLNALVAACSDNPASLGELLDAADRFDKRLKEYVTTGLAVFDEHNSIGNPAVIHSALDHCHPHELPVFRVLDDRTRQASLQPVKAGVIIFNLYSHRIVEVMNSYDEIRRKGNVRVHDGKKYTPEVRRYELPGDWRLVPPRAEL